MPRTSVLKSKRTSPKPTDRPVDRLIDNQRAMETLLARLALLQEDRDKILEEMRNAGGGFGGNSGAQL